MFTVLAKSILHNLGVIIVGLCFAYLGKLADPLFRFRNPVSLQAKGVGSALMALGFAVRAWAAAYFYSHRMRVISLRPQGALITGGPYRFSRNPLYLGGNVFIFFGAALFVGSATALLATLAHLPLMDRMVRREEGQLEKEFCETWRDYKSRVPRWI